MDAAIRSGTRSDGPGTRTAQGSPGPSDARISVSSVTVTDRAQLSIRTLKDSWQKLGWSLSTLRARSGDQVSLARLSSLESGAELPTAREVDVLVDALGMDRAQFDLQVRSELIQVLDQRAGGTGSLFPRIHINVDLVLADQDQALEPAKRLMVTYVGGVDRTSSEMLVTPELVKSLAQLCGLDPLDCWLRLCRYIDKDE